MTPSVLEMSGMVVFPLGVDFSPVCLAFIFPNISLLVASHNSVHSFFLYISILVSLDSHLLLFLDLMTALRMAARNRSFHFSQMMLMSLIMNNKSQGAFFNYGEKLNIICLLKVVHHSSTVRSSRGVLPRK